ncbi:MAG: hypothetical protein HY920_05860 [Elusimicrobia bacterium]|nr:hypothetical protein [Elusimicrobiota bacterium]
MEIRVIKYRIEIPILKYRILLLDRRRMVTDSRLQEKCCGGLLVPDAQGFLAQFGLGLPREVLVGPQLFSVRTIDLENHLERHYQRHYGSKKSDKTGL